MRHSSWRATGGPLTGGARAERDRGLVEFGPLRGSHAAIASRLAASFSAFFALATADAVISGGASASVG